MKHTGRGLPQAFRRAWLQVNAVKRASIRWGCAVTVHGQSTRRGLLRDFGGNA